MVKKIEVAVSDVRRNVAKEADVMVVNRFIEPNAILSDAQPAHIARPGLKYWKSVGEGPIRKIFHQPGAFDDDLFVVSGDELYRVDRITGDETLISSTIFGNDTGSSPSMACTGDFAITGIGPRLWIADGQQLYVYMEDGYATGRLTYSGTISDGDTVRIGTVYYRFSTGSLDSGSPAGTSGNPWRVLIGVSEVISLTNLYKAINASGTPGTEYSTALTTESPDAVAMTATTSGLYVRSTLGGLFGNATVTTETGANLSWTNGGTMTNGNTPGLFTVPTPDDVGVLSVATINQFIIVIPSQGEGLNGRFYFIRPGEVVIDPLDFYTAERSADPIYQCIVFGDQFWLAGQDTTEVWYCTGNDDNPMQRLQGVVFDRGVHNGTAIQVKTSMVLVDSLGGVFQISGGENRISTPDIEERIRKAIALQNILSGN